MKTISYVIDPDGYIELVLREPNSHQIIPETYSDTAQLTLICRTPALTIRLQLAVTPFPMNSKPSRQPLLVLRKLKRIMSRRKSVCASP
ncbi:hypothetical protein FOMA001_g1794 [Fusarium oxysporum f. sp. matthiolae]|nr:hypothetical protein FOMA001_g1794 [Fusarium oxysporum f. sp. matthiolae]